VLKAVYRSTCRDRHNCQRGGGSLTPQSDAPTTRTRRLVCDSSSRRRRRRTATATRATATRHAVTPSLSSSSSSWAPASHLQLVTPARRQPSEPVLPASTRHHTSPPPHPHPHLCRPHRPPLLSTVDCGRALCTSTTHDNGAPQRLLIGVNAAEAAGVATSQYLTCRGRPVLTSPRYFDKCFILSLQRNF